MQLYFIASDFEQAQYYQHVLEQRGVNIQLHEIEQLNARFLRRTPELALAVDQKRLWLCANGMKMQPDWQTEVARLKRATLKSEMLARACQVSDTVHIVDATAGLGHDGLLLSALGAHVTLLERNPILFTLLEDAMQQAQHDPFLQKIITRITLVYTDSASFLLNCDQHKQQLDVIYLDPMFPQRDQNHQAIKKHAQVKKQMQILHLLLPEHGEMDLGDALLPLAQHVAKRVIVKRPRHAVFLNQQTPDHQWLGDACRFDAYFQLTP